MRFRGDERAQSVQVGAVILFGFLVVGLSVYQVSVVPQQNSQVEFDQSQAIREDMSELRNQLQRTGVTGESRPVELQLGARFPPRTLFVNPPPTSGTIRTENKTTANVTVVSGTVESSADGQEVLDYWQDDPPEFTAKLLVYEGNYRVYDGAPDNVTVQLGHAVASYPGDRTVNVTDRPGLVSSDRLTLVLVQGDLSEGGVDRVTVDPESVSRITRRETINGTVNVTVPTTLPPSKVQGLLNRADTGITVEAVTSVRNGEAVRVELDGRIQLGIAAVGVGSGSPAREPGYVDVESRENVTAGADGEATFEVRDEFGNPLGGQRLNLTVVNKSGEAVLTDTTVTTNPEGRATVEYTGLSPGVVTLRASFVGDPAAATFDPRTPANASVDARIVRPVGTGNGTGNGTGAGTVNPPGSVQLVGSFRDGNNEAVFTLKNTGNTTKNLSRARIAFYFNRQGNDDPTDAMFVTSDNQPTMAVGGDYQSVDNVSFPPNTEVNVCVRFSGGAGGNDVEDDFFVTNFEFTDGTVRQYFVTPENRGPSCDAGGTGGGGGGSPLPAGAVAFNDADGDGAYDSGETTYSANDLKNGNGIDSTTDLVIERAVDVNGDVDLDTNSVTVRANVSVKNKLKLESNNEIVVESGVLVESRNKQLELNAAGLLDVRGAIVRAANEKINTFSGSLIRADGATLVSGGDFQPSATNSVTFDGATIDAGGSVQIDSGSFIDMIGTTVSVVGTGGDGITINSNGNVDLTDATLEGDASSDFNANLNTGSNDLFVNNAAFLDGGGNGKTLCYDPDGISVNGTPTDGTVSKC